MVLAHGTNHPLLHIIVVIHIIIIFLFRTASTNLIVVFPLKPMIICIYTAGQLLRALKVLFYNPFLSYSY